MQQTGTGNATGSYQVMAKPIGPVCNLGCRYCFYLEKKELFPGESSFRMSPQVLDRFISQQIAVDDTDEVQFTWQGGEPTLLGIDFFRQALELQKKYAVGKKIANSIQTNGILLNDEWCEFLGEHDFLVGISIDGPRDLHDRYRVDRKGRSCFDAVMRGIAFLKKHRVRFNTLTVVNDVNARHPLKVYRFLQEIGDGFMQFIPLVERLPGAAAGELGLAMGMPSDGGGAGMGGNVTPWSVQSKNLADFYIRIFDHWVAADVGAVFVQLFDVALGNWMGAGAGLCQFSPTCGRAVALEHNGDLFSCDHYVYPQYRLGNILEKSLAELLSGSRQTRFGNAKRDQLSEYCRQCKVRSICNGDCPKHRFETAPDGEPGLSYLCGAYKRIFTYMQPFMEIMGSLLQTGKPAAMIMDYVAAADRQVRFASAGRNDSCPCGSGKKFKRCCGA